MTKTATKTTAANTYFEQVKQTFEGFQNKLEVPASARDFVKNGADKAANGADTVHSTATKIVDGAEKLTHSFIGGYANFVRGAFDMTLANVKASLETLEKVAGAKSVNEAIQIQTAFVRENTAANIEKVRVAAETARASVVDGAKAVQSEVSSFYKKAA